MAARNVSTAATARVFSRVGSWRECLSTFGPAAKAGNDRRRLRRGAAERAAKGEEIVIAKAGKPKAKLVPLRETAARREPVNLLGITFIAEDFDEPLPPEIQSAFEADQ